MLLTFWLRICTVAIVAGYFVAVIVCITMHAPLINNPNRAGKPPCSKHHVNRSSSHV